MIVGTHDVKMMVATAIGVTCSITVVSSSGRSGRAPAGIGVTMTMTATTTDIKNTTIVHRKVQPTVAHNSQ